MFTFGNYEFKLNSNGETVSGVSNFQLERVQIVEKICSLPTFMIDYSMPGKFEARNYKEAELQLRGGYQEWSWDLTATSFTPTRISGLLLKSNLVFERSSQNLSDSLSDSINSLGIRPEIEGCESVNSPDTFYQYNETKAECAVRLLDMSGQDTLWTISSDKILVFPISISSPKKISVGNETYFVCNRQRSSETNFTPLQGDTERYNINFGRYSACIPRLSGYPKDCVASTIQKRKFRSNLFNTSVSKTYNEEPELFVGDSVSVQEWEPYTENINFIVVGRTMVLERYNSNYIIEMVNVDGWL